MTKPDRGGGLPRIGRGAALAACSAVAARLAWDLRTSLGGRRAEIDRRTAGSPHRVGRRFVNVEPTEVVRAEASWPTIVAGFLRRALARGPRGGIPTVAPDPGPAPHTLAVTWLGHASALIEVDGHTVLTDPIWSRYVSPTQLWGLRRLHPPPLPIHRLPPLDAIVISHDHFDHLDPATVRALSRNTIAPFVVPLGVGAHLHAWRVPEERIVELDWWQSTTVGELVITCTPARHYSGRTVLSNDTLWASWSIAGPEHRAYFGGDTGPTALHGEIARRVGPFDLVLLPIGAYDPAWPDIHLDPAQALAAYRQLAHPDSTLLPIHWATFALAPHPWAEPVEWLLREADDACAIRTPIPGRRVALRGPHATPATPTHWWADRPARARRARLLRRGCP